MIRIFPNRESTLRLLSALLLERHEQWTTGQSLLRHDSLLDDSLLAVAARTGTASSGEGKQIRSGQSAEPESDRTMSEPTHDASVLVNRLEAEYDLDHGFLGRLRQGEFDPTGLSRLLHLLQSIDFGEAAFIDRRAVALLWMIPTLMTWQLKRVAEQKGDIERLRRAIDQVQTILAAPAVLGMP